MVGSINKAILIGNVGRDPEIRVTQDGREIAHVAIATSESWRDKSTGERREKTEWHRVVVFSEGLVNIVKVYVKKGSKLYIEGAIQTRKWVDNNGAERYTTEIVLQGYNASIMILDNKGSQADHSHSEIQEKPQSSPPTEKPNFYNEELDDEVPF